MEFENALTKSNASRSINYSKQLRKARKKTNSKPKKLATPLYTPLGNYTRPLFFLTNNFKPLSEVVK